MQTTVLNLEKNAIEVIKSEEVKVHYTFRMYHGPKFVMVSLGDVSRMVEVRGYGMEIVRTVTFHYAPSPEVVIAMQNQGYLFDKNLTATWKKDYGYLTAHNYELNGLVHKLHRSNYSWGKMTQFIQSQISSWGEVTTTPEGVTRNPFARAARLVLVKELENERRAKRLSSYKESDK